MPAPPATRARAVLVRAAEWAAGHRRLVAGGAVALLLLALYPVVVGGLAAHLFASRASARLGRPVVVGRGRAGFGQVTLENVTIPGTATGPALLIVDEIQVPFGVAMGGKGPIEVRGARAYVVRGGATDNVSAILERLRQRRPKGAAPEPAGPTPPGVVVDGAALELRDALTGLSISIARLDGRVRPGERLDLRMRKVRGLLAVAGEGKGPTFGGEELDLQTALNGMRPAGIPALRVQGGYATPLPSLALTGIAGVIAPAPDMGTPKGSPNPPATGSAGQSPAAPTRSGTVIIDLRGSYGGARQTLWTAKGQADPERREGKLSLRAEQFSLDKIRDVLPRSVLKPEATRLDASLEVNWEGDAVRFGGATEVVGLSMQHDALAADPIENVSVGLAVSGTAYPGRRRLELVGLEARVRDLTARLSGTIELPPGTYRFANGSKLGVVPKIDLALNVPKLPCAKLLASIPEALTPKLQGFVLKGTFEAIAGVKVDFADLDALELRGKVGIDGCKVLQAPDGVVALAGPESLVVNVEVPPAPLPGTTQPARMAAGTVEPETMSVVIGPENPDFTPYDQISPYLVASIMTTEDNGFFKHRGWVTSEFKSALRRNLARGGFRLGASSITMQMTKNVLLSQEKTLSRKLQELFLVWYIEQMLPKERILELYFNAIEFGPRIYGIGAAVRHYFGKRPAELNPLEAAFFSSILPSPKRRYIQYCHGTLFPPWDKYVHRILAKVHERGRITDDEYAAWAPQTLTFDRKEASFTEKQCLEWVKTITARPEPEAPPELEDDTDDAGLASSTQKRLRRLFVRGPSKHPARSIATRASN